MNSTSKSSLKFYHKERVKEMAKVEFKEGDLVRVIGNSKMQHYARAGMVGTVIATSKSVIAVEFNVIGYGKMKQMISKDDLKVVRK